MIDFVMPQDNEEEFIRMAEKLGYKELVLLYDFNNYSDKKLEVIGKKIKISNGIIADAKNIDKIKNKIKNEGVFIAVKSSAIDREIIEKNKANLIFGFEESNRKDFFNQRVSGLDHILCRLAHDNNIMIGFSVSLLLNSENKHIILGRMMQNINLCRKFKVRTVMASFANNPYEMRGYYDLKRLLLLLAY